MNLSTSRLLKQLDDRIQDEIKYEHTLIACSEDGGMEEDTEDPPTPLTDFFCIMPITPVMVEEKE